MIKAPEYPPQTGLVNLASKLGRRRLLRLGYAAVIAVLTFSVVEAYRIQVNVSQQHIDIFYRYVEQEDAVASLRSNLWLAGNYVRDFFIKTSPAAAEILSMQLKDLERKNEAPLATLARSFPKSDEFAGLQRDLAEFWALLDRVPVTMLHVSDQHQVDFARNVIEPRRGQLAAALRQLGSAGERSVQESSQQIIQARHVAAQRLVAILLVGGILGLLVAVISMRHSDRLARRAERHYAEAEQARREMQQLSGRLLEVEEEIRRRLARELHDEIGQTLALLEIEVSRAQNAATQGQIPALQDRLLRARTLAEETVQTVRSMSVLLRPALLDDLGLTPALHFQMDQFQRRSGIAGELIQENVPEQLPDAVNTCVYRVVQEALHNCEKHSGASLVRVSVRQRSGALLVEVEDNGCGFQPNQKRAPDNAGGLGLLGMRERAAMVGGRLHIESAPGRGTRLILHVPVPEAAYAKSAAVAL